METGWKEILRFCGRVIVSPKLSLLRGRKLREIPREFSLIGEAIEHRCVVDFLQGFGEKVFKSCERCGTSVGRGLRLVGNAQHKSEVQRFLD
jgi:hypothetical protein